MLCFMKTLIAALCHYATEHGNNLTVSGCFDKIIARQLPIIQHHFTIALRLLITHETDNNDEKEFCLSIIDTDGRLLDPVKMPYCVDIDTSLPPSADFISRNYIFNCHGMEFAFPGEYSVDFSVNGNLAIRIPFRVEIDPDYEESPDPPVFINMQKGTA